MANLIQEALNILHPQKILSPLPPDQTLNTPQTMNYAQSTQKYLQSVYPQILRDMGITSKNVQGGIKQAVAHINAVNQVQAQATPTPTPWNTKTAVDGYVMNTPREFIPAIKKSAQTYGVPTSILSGLLSKESMGFNPDVISGKLDSPVGAQGIAQFMPTTAKGMGVNPLDPDQAIMGAGKLLRAHYDQFGNDPAKALGAYNAGPGAVAQYNGVPPYPETQNYVSGILNDAKTVYTGN